MAKKMKRLLSLIICIMMIVSSFAVITVAGASQFKDMPNNWSTAALTHAADNGLLLGKGDGMICPDDYLTRAEMATIINRAFNSEIAADITSYIDVSSSDWYYNEFGKALNMQTFYGTGDNQFRPQNAITREEVFIAIARALVVSTSDFSSLDKFSDGGDVSSWAKEFVAALVAQGYVNGYGDGLILPKNNITRAEFAQLLYNIFKQYISTPGTYNDVVANGGVVIRDKDISLENVTINGDLVIADGVGDGVLTLTNVKVNGRLLVRGSKQITVTNCEFSEGIVVKNVNGLVHFNNYRNEQPFKNLTEVTKVTFKTRSSGGHSVGGTTEYTVTYDAGNGTTPTTETVVRNGKATKPALDPTKDGFTFLGWYVAPDAPDAVEEEFDFDNTSITADITIYAHWGYTVKFFKGMTDIFELDEKAYHPGICIPSEDVPEEREPKEGFYKDGTISSLYSANSDKHYIDSTWFYKDTNGKWNEFDVESDIVNSNLELHNGSRHLVISVYLNNVNHGFDISTPYEIDIADSHLTNVFKDMIFINRTNINNAYNNAKLDEKKQQLKSKLIEYGFIDQSENILIQKRGIKFAAILGNSQVRSFIIENSKRQLKTNAGLNDDLMQYIKDMNHSTLTQIVYDALVACDEHNDPELKDYTEDLLNIYLAPGSTYMDAADLIATQMQVDPIFEQDMLDHLVDYLDAHPDELDEIVEEILTDGRYKDMLDTFVNQMINNKKFDINNDNKFIAEGMKIKLSEMTSYESVFEFVGSGMERYFDKLTKIIPEQKIQEIYNKALTDYIDELTDAIDSVSASSSAQAPTFVTATVNPITDLLNPIYEKVINITELELDNHFYYNENVYLKELFNLITPQAMLEGDDSLATDTHSGYKLKEFDDYYFLLMQMSVLIDDVADWYVSEGGLSQVEKDEIMARIEEKIMQLFSYYNKILALVDEYAQTGELPDKIDNEFVERFEEIINSKFPFAQKLIDRLVGSQVNRPLTDSDFDKFCQMVDLLFKDRTLTVDDLFDSSYAAKLNKFRVDEDTYKVTSDKFGSITIKREHR